MKRIISILICFLLCSISPLANAQGQNLEQRVKAIQREQTITNKKVSNIATKVANDRKDISTLLRQNKELGAKVDSLSDVATSLAHSQKANKDSLNGKIESTNDELSTNKSDIANRTTWGIVIALVVLILIALVTYLIIKKINKGTNTIENTIDDVRKTQESLQNAQTKLQEDSVKLDNKMLDIAQKQLDIWGKEKNVNKTEEPDHSLIVKLADEIARIETNLSKMDKSVRGYKQLVQAKDRMINNVKAYGYDIISLIGQEYNDGMQFQARFVPDDSLPEGKRIITGMIKMQVNYNGKMIQPAEIVVSQNI